MRFLRMGQLEGKIVDNELPIPSIKGNRQMMLRLCRCTFLFPVVALTIAGTGLAQAQGSPLSRLSSPFEQAQQAFEALPEIRRKEIQDGLVWSGDYKGGIDGEFGRMTMRAITAYESRGKGARDGILSLRDINALTQAANRRKAAVDFRLVREPRSGVRIALPMKLLKRRDSSGGAIFESRDKALRLRTFMVPESQQSLADLYQDLTARVRGRRVGYKVLRNDFVVVSTESRTRFSYIRAARVPLNTTNNDNRGEAVLRGFTFSVAQSLLRKRRSQIEILTIAISNSFDPAPSAASEPRTASRAPDAATESPVQSKPVPPAEYLAGTALAIAPDTYVTVLPAAGCSAVRIGKAPAKLEAKDEATGVALFKAPVGGGVPAKIAHVAQAASGPAFGLFADLPYPGANAHISIARGSLTGKGNAVRARIAMPVSATGGLIVTGAGDLAGFVAPGGVGGKKIAGPIPAASRSLIAPAVVRAFLERSGIKGSPISAKLPVSASAPTVEPASIQSAASIAARYARALTPVWCRR